MGGALNEGILTELLADLKNIRFDSRWIPLLNCFRLGSFKFATVICLAQLLASGRWLPRSKVGWPCSRWSWSSSGPGRQQLLWLIYCLEIHIWRSAFRELLGWPAKRLLPTLTMKMVGFSDGDLGDSKLILHRQKDKQEKFKALSFGRDLDEDIYLYL